MADKTGIAWTDASWNVLRGCSKVSAGCKNCHAEKMAARFCSPPMPTFVGHEETKPGAYHGLITDGRWNGKVRFVEHMLDQPLRWKKPRLIFVNSMSDLFHEAVPFETIAAIFGVMAASPQHTFQCLTKRADRMLAFFEWLAKKPPIAEPLRVEPIFWCGHHAKRTGSSLLMREELNQRTGKPWEGNIQADTAWPLPNVWLGVSCEDQEAADGRIPLLLQCPAAVRWVSYEPALGPIDFGDWLWSTGDLANDEPPAALDWLVVGGENQTGARAFDLEWARSTVAQCKAAGVACFVKQMGSVPVETTRPEPGRILTRPFLGLTDRAGADPSEWPADLRVREYPKGGE